MIFVAVASPIRLERHAHARDRRAGMKVRDRRREDAMLARLLVAANQGTLGAQPSARLVATLRAPAPPAVTAPADRPGR
jgi:hypothetical protein